MRGIILDDFDVAGQAGAGVGAFDQIVAEQGVAGEAAVEDAMDGVDLVDAFAGEAAFAVEILIGVGDGAGVDVESGFSGVDGGEAGAGGALDADADAGLQDAVTGDDDVFLRIDDGAIERMGESSDHAMRGSARKFGVGIEGDHELNARKNRGVADLDRESCRIGRAGGG